MKQRMVKLLDIIIAAWAAPHCSGQNRLGESPKHVGGIALSQRLIGKALPLWLLLLTGVWMGVFSVDAHAQQADWLNAARNDTFFGERYLVMNDAQSFYIAGYFEGNLTFGSTTISSPDKTSIYLAKFDLQGHLIQIRQFGGSGSVQASGLAIDSAGNLYLAGQFYSDVTIGPVTLTSGPFGDVFIAKFDPSGNLIWTKVIAGATERAYSDELGVDSAGNVFVMGAMTGAIDFGGKTLTSAGNYDAYLAKYDTNGLFLWANQLGGSGQQRGSALAVHNGMAYIVGNFDGITSVSSATSGPTTLTAKGYPVTATDIFVAAYDANGGLLWARNDGGTSDDVSEGVAVDSSGNAYVTGQFLAVAGFGPISVKSVGSHDGFIAKYDSHGAPLWVQTIAGSDHDEASRITIDNAGNIYITGEFTPQDAAIGTTMVNGNGFLIARYDKDGHFTWVQRVSSTGNLFAIGLTVDSNGYVYSTGFYQGTATFGPLTVSDSREGIFLARWSPASVVDPIFSDGFESGDFTAWTNYSSDFGDLSVTPAAALVGNQGLSALLDDNVTIGMRDETPAGEKRYRARFYFDPNSLTMAQDENHVIFFGYSGSDLRRPVLRVELRYHNGSYQLRSGIVDDDITWRVSRWFSISDQPHLVELDWRAATAPGANDGSVGLLIDEVIRSVMGNVDNDTRRIDTTRLGAIAGIDPGTHGVDYFDAFASRRLTYIGPEATVAVAMAAPAAVTDVSEITASTDHNENEPEEAALRQEVLAYADQVEREQKSDQKPQLFLPWTSH